MKHFGATASLFLLGSFIGWCLESMFRNRTRIFHSDTGKAWVNPGFCMGPYLPIYGLVQIILYVLAQVGRAIDFGSLILNQATVLCLMTLGITLLEYIVGVLAWKLFHERYWDYSGQKWNIGGYISLKFTFYWFLLSVNYNYILHPYFLRITRWQENHPLSKIFLALFMSIFVVDFLVSVQKNRRVKTKKDVNVL